MIDPKLEREISDIKELMAKWRQFHDFLAIGVKGENITPEKEKQFLAIKSRIAMLHETFIEVLTHDKYIGQTIMAIVMTSITLKHLNKLSTAEIKKMEIEWHEAFLLLNETIGVLEDQKAQLSETTATQRALTKAGSNAFASVTNFITHRYTKMVVILIVVIVALYGINASGIIQSQKLYKYGLYRDVYSIYDFLLRKISPNRSYISLDQIFFTMDRRSKYQEKTQKDFYEIPNGIKDLNEGQAYGMLKTWVTGMDIAQDKLADVREGKWKYQTQDIQLIYFLFTSDSKLNSADIKITPEQSNNMDFLIKGNLLIIFNCPSSAVRGEAMTIYK